MNLNATKAATKRANPSRNVKSWFMTVTFYPVVRATVRPPKRALEISQKYRKYALNT